MCVRGGFAQNRFAQLSRNCAEPVLGAASIFAEFGLQQPPLPL
jgi:hypothetical protein